MDNFPIARELVLVGGGHSHVIFLRMLGMNPVPGLKVTLISPDTRTPYSGMLPGLIAGHYHEDEVYIDLVPLCRFAGVDFIQSKVSAMDMGEQTVALSGRPAVHYDVLSLDIGSAPALDASISNADVISVKPISTFLARWKTFVRKFESEVVSDIGFVGAGAGGVELCLAVQHFLEKEFPERSFRTHLISEGKTILPEFNPSTRIQFERLLATRNIQVHREFRATSAADGVLVSADAREVQLDDIFWITQASAQPWPSASGLDVDAAGFINVRESLQTVSSNKVFAVGDCATMVNHPRPKAGVYAVRQGKPLFRNVMALLLGSIPKPYKPQSNFLSLISTGPQHAIASRNGFSLQGYWAWRWKNWIDSRFMKRFSELPNMHRGPENSLQAEFDDTMHCGGCGSKVSADLLHEVLKDILGGSAPVDDAAQIEVPVGKTLLQSVDHFRSFVNDPYLQARIAVCHSVSDIYACGGAPHSVLASLTLPFGKPGVTKSLLIQILQGTVDQLQEEGATLVGGHTSEGLELSIGFTANGMVDPSDAWSKQGSSPGDVLVLTKALGTGTILAADMRHLAKGPWVSEALLQMTRSNSDAVIIAKKFTVGACTDITGFGLAGHCLEMTGPGLGIEIQLSNLPIMSGATECLHALGITSSLHEANRRSSGLSGLAADAEILFDPQTSGGLLFSVPAEESGKLVSALKRGGYEQASIVGRVTKVSGIQVVI
jgi:selenide, water dikinase